MRRREGGSVTLMTMGFLLVIGLLTVVVVNASAAFLQRQELDNLADGAALAAADGLSRETFYRRGDVELDRGEARRLMRAYVTDDGVRITRVTIDDEEVGVRLERTIGLALAPPGWASSTTIVSEATAQLRQGE